MKPLPGIELVASDMVPETQLQALDDADERLHAMTAHHLDLSLLDLTSPEPVVFHAFGRIFCHPNNLARIRAELEALRG